MHKKLSGFTIVELLIVIVVIAILATISIVAYRGIQERTRAAEVSAGLNQAKKKLELYKVDNGNYPTTGNLADAGVIDKDVSYQYTSDGTNYCLTGTAGTTSYKATNTTNPEQGGCAGHGQGGVAAVTNLSPNPSIETNTSSFNIYSGGTTTRSTAFAFDGSASARVQPAANTAFSGMSQSITGLTNGRTYTYSFYIYRTSASENLVHFIDGVGETSISAPINTWTRFSRTFTYTSYSNWGVRQNNATASPTPYYIDAITYTEGSSPLSGYFDGNSPNWAWNGTPNNSTSTGPAL